MISTHTLDINITSPTLKAQGPLGKMGQSEETRGQGAHVFRICQDYYPSMPSSYNQNQKEDMKLRGVEVGLGEVRGRKRDKYNKTYVCM